MAKRQGVNNKQAEIILSLISPLIVAVFVALLSAFAYGGINFRKFNSLDIILYAFALAFLIIAGGILIKLFFKYLKGVKNE